MITRNNPTAQSNLFAAAEDVLTKYKTRFAGMKMNHIDDYFACLRTLATLELQYPEDIDPIFTILPPNEGYFSINADTRDIEVPDAFKAGVSVQGDDIAEIIYFKIDRYFDAIDLAQKQIVIQWQHESDANSSKQNTKFLSAAYKRSLQAEPGFIVFGWPITKEVTAKPGNINFSVRFYSIETNEITGEQYIDYSFSTVTKNIKIKPSLNFNLTQDALNNVLDSNKRIYDNLRDSESTVSYDVAEPAFSKYVIIDPLNNLLPSGNKTEDLPATFGVKAEIFKSALIDGAQMGAKPLAYQWYKTESTDVKGEPVDSNIVSEKYFSVQGEEYNPYEFYYMNIGSTEAPEWKIYEPNDDNAFNDGVDLYARYSVLTPVEAGYYYAIARNNLTFNKYAEKKSELWLVPFAEEPIYSYLPESKKVYLDEENHDITITAEVNIGELNYQWFYGDTEKFEESKLSDKFNENQTTITPVVEGYYFLKATNNRNNNSSKEASEGVLATYHASKPQIIGHYVGENAANGDTIFNDNKAAISIALGVMEHSDDQNNLKYEWYYRIDKTVDYSLIQTLNGDSKLVPQNEGYYQCKVYNTYRGDVNTEISKEFYVK